MGNFNNRIFKLQNRALRIISFSDLRADCTPFYRDLKILKLDDYIVLQNCLLVHDALHRVSPVCFHDFFKYSREVHSLHTRTYTSDQLFVKHSNSIRYGINSITSKCISNWNQLTSLLKVSLYDVTRYKLKKVIQQHCLDSYN